MGLQRGVPRSASNKATETEKNERSSRAAGVLVIGGGPAGLAAAMAAVEAGASVTVAEAGRIAGRKFLVAGKGGLNLTHAEPLPDFLSRYGDSAERLAPFVRAHPPDELRALAAALGQETFVGTSGRVFPKDAKAAPMLRAWLARLRARGVELRTRRRLVGLSAGGKGGGVEAEFVDTRGARERVRAGAIVLALGGASWPETGSTGAWIPLLREAGVDVAPLSPSNAGVDVELPVEFLEANQGAALKHVALSLGSERAAGDVVITRTGLEGAPVYRLNRAVREALARDGRAELLVDLKPDLTVDALTAKLGSAGGKSLSTRLSALKFSPSARALLRTRPREAGDAHAVASRLKAFPVRVRALRPIAEAISSAGGVRWSALDEHLMLRALPGVFVAGEMIDWDAPTGGYLLQACWSTGAAAGAAAASHAARRPSQ